MSEEKLELPVIQWSDFPNGELPTKAIGSRILLIALDTEYQSNYTANTNLCLSYQYAVYDLYDGTYKSGIFYTNINAQERYALGEFTHKVLGEINKSPSSLRGYRIIYIAHFFSAEWAMFKDRKELYMKFEYIRKSLITTNRPLKTTIMDENGATVNLFVDVRDTMLLLPEGYKSLDKASEFIEGYEKIDIGIENKINMLKYLQERPVEFEKYAIRDAEVTLKLFIKLQFLLNKINDTEDKLFSTLASATTNDFKKFSSAKFGIQAHQMQYDRFHTLYKKYESIADRSYQGGLNSSYYIGESIGYTFLDIDFKNAYPTAMNLLKIADFGEKIPKPTKQNYSASSLEELKYV